MTWILFIIGAVLGLGPLCLDEGRHNFAVGARLVALGVGLAIMIIAAIINQIGGAA